MNECTAASMPARLIAATIVRMCSLMKTLHSIYSLCSHRMTSDSRPPQLFEQKEKTGRRMIVYNYRLPGGQEYCRQCALGPLAALRNSSSMLLCSGANGPPCTNTSSAACRSAELYQARLIATCSETAAATPPPSSIDRIGASSIVMFSPCMYSAKFFQPTSNARTGSDRMCFSGISLAINKITDLILERRVHSAAWLGPFGIFFEQNRNGSGKLSVTVHHARQAASHDKCGMQRPFGKHSPTGVV